MKDFKKLKIWQKAHAVTMGVYSATQAFPSEEMYGLTSQIRRACVSIPSNIVEGCGRNSEREMKRFFEIAMGSASEVEYQLFLAKELQFLSLARYRTLEGNLVELKKMLNVFIQKLKANC